jgi:Pyruvate phosphate dikinase, AMP/ATP-binding domain
MVLGVGVVLAVLRVDESAAQAYVPCGCRCVCVCVCVYCALLRLCCACCALTCAVALARWCCSFAHSPPIHRTQHVKKSSLLESPIRSSSEAPLLEEVVLNEQESAEVREARDLFVNLNSSDPYEMSRLLTIEHVGGKALRLAEMMQAQRSSAQNMIDVPAAGCVTTFGYESHVAAANLTERIHALLHGAGTRESSAQSKELTSIRQMILGTPVAKLVRIRVDVFLRSLPEHIQSLAVRSSSTMEDLHGRWSGR